MTQTAAPAARRRRTDVPRYAVLVVTSLLFFAPVAYMVAASLAPASRTLAEMCEDHWRWQKGNPEGFGE